MEFGQRTTTRGRLPLFDNEKYIGNRSFSVIEALYARGLFTVERNKKGYVVRADCVHMPTTSGEPPDQRTQAALETPRNQRYSFRDAAIVQRPWDLKRLNGARSGIHYAPASVIPDFTVVVSGCLHELRRDYLSNLQLLARIFSNHMPHGSLFLLLAYQPPENGHRRQPLVLTRVDHSSTVN